MFSRNTWIVFSREYLTRVKKKSFLLTTFLTPLALVLFIVVVSMIMSYRGGDMLTIGVVDESGGIAEYLEDNSYVTFETNNWTIEEATEASTTGDYSGVVVIPPIDGFEFDRLSIRYLSDGKLDLEGTSEIESQIKEAARQYKIENLNLDMSKVELLNTRVSLQPEKITKLVEDEQSRSTLTTYIASGIGVVMGVLMYFVVFFNGTRVMQSVMEEKTNRIVEVMISSVRPFQLMMGKILGVGLVGLTQFFLWIVLIPIIFLIAQPFLGLDTQELANQNMPNEQDMQAVRDMTDGVDINLILSELMGLNWWMIIPLFILYFLLGYVLYATLFAAVGSAIGDDIQEGQSLTIPITIPVIVAFYIMISTIRSPNSNLAIWSSIFPLFSPIVMPARLAYDPPFWQLASSIILLIGCVFLMVWISAKIYRVGILMYGKKASFKEIFKWVTYRN